MACLGTEGFEIASTRQSLEEGDRTETSLPGDEFSI